MPTLKPKPLTENKIFEVKYQFCCYAYLDDCYIDVCNFFAWIA